MWAFLFHRLTAIFLAGYLLLHTFVVHSLVYGPTSFDRTMAFLKRPLFKLLEIGLLGIILFHCLNGLRLFFVNIGLRSKYHRLLFWILIALGFVLLLFGAYPLLPFTGGGL